VAGSERDVDATSHVLQKMQQVENDHAGLQLGQEWVLSLAKQAGMLSRETRMESLRIAALLFAMTTTMLRKLWTRTAGTPRQ
jgi:hypothetical protein